ncbi:MAG TPA: hypothetical protein VGG10_15330 [Rhizomicrobium sp.]
MTLHPDALRSRAESLRREADRLAQDARNIEERREAAADHDRRKRWIYYYAMEAAKGSDVLADMTARLGLSASDALALLRSAEQKYGRIARARRDREICNLAWTHRNAEIAARFGMHPNSVSRIISKHTRGWLRVK